VRQKLESSSMIAASKEMLAMTYKKKAHIVESTLHRLEETERRYLQTSLQESSAYSPYWPYSPLAVPKPAQPIQPMQPMQPVQHEQDVPPLGLAQGLGGTTVTFILLHIYLMDSQGIGYKRPCVQNVSTQTVDRLFCNPTYIFCCIHSCTTAAQTPGKFRFQAPM
jgi:hypothetical protein